MSVGGRGRKAKRAARRIEEPIDDGGTADRFARLYSSFKSLFRPRLMICQKMTERNLVIANNVKVHHRSLDHGIAVRAVTSNVGFRSTAALAAERDALGATVARLGEEHRQQIDQIQSQHQLKVKAMNERFEKECRVEVDRGWLIRSYVYKVYTSAVWNF